MIMILCDSVVESSKEGLSTPSQVIDCDNSMTEEYIEAVYDESELEEKVMDVVDKSLTEGYLGLNVWNTSVKFNNILVETLD